MLRAGERLSMNRITLFAPFPGWPPRSRHKSNLLHRFAVLAWTVGVLAFAEFPCVTVQSEETAKRPNIVVILADDKYD
jgi:hypothetical protein